MNQQANPTIITTGIQTWLHNRNMRRFTYYIETPFGRFYVVNNERIPAQEFESLYPIDLLDIA